MSSQIVEITSAGIRKILDKYTPEKAIAEYVWNGFDAKATTIHIDFLIDNEEYDKYKEIRITDNGTGICYEELSDKFKKFHESNKPISDNSNVDLTKGKNGCGRLTFFKFARFAKWETRYEKGTKVMSYEISVSNDDLKKYTTTSVNNTNSHTGTSVVFSEIENPISTPFINKTLIPFLKAEFAWFLELKEENKIFVNGKELDYFSIITDKEDFSIDVSLNRKIHKFNCKYIRWSKKLNDEFSRFYFLNSRLKLKNNQTTKLNKKGDEFWHSIIIVDDFFDSITYGEEKTNSSQLRLSFDTFEDKGAFNSLINQLNDYLKSKRRPFLKKQADALINRYEEEQVFPIFDNNDWDKVRKEGLENLVKNIYEVEPAVFMKLNKEQKRVFLELLNLVMDSGERDSLFKILENVVDLDTNDRKEFAKILETTRLQQVISTIKLVSDRILALSSLEKIVFNHELKANEKDHLQTFIEKHYWIFGEEYRMVCAEEVKFEKALRKYIHILRGVDEKTYITHPDKYKEMDLFLTGTDFRDGKPHNIVVEIKNPTTIKKITNTEYSQLETYMDIILRQDCFNDKNEFWTFMLIGQDYDDIIGRKITDKNTGLILKGDNFNLFVKKWSEVINEVNRRLKYLLEKLKLEREALSTDSDTLGKVMNNVTNNSAVMK